MNKETIFVINPNSTHAVTEGIDAAMNVFRGSGGPAIECLTLEDGPRGIQSQLDVDSVVLPLLALARSLEGRAAAFVIACFSDPGLYTLREFAPCPVFGIGQSAVLAALTMGERFGVIATMSQSIPRHLRTWRAMGLDQRFAGELAIELPPHEIGKADQTLNRMIAVGARLRDECHADVMVMGCAGMASYRESLQAALGIPVVEPSQAAVSMAIGRIYLKWENASPRSLMPRVSVTSNEL